MCHTYLLPWRGARRRSEVRVWFQVAVFAFVVYLCIYTLLLCFVLPNLTASVLAANRKTIGGLPRMTHAHSGDDDHFAHCGPDMSKQWVRRRTGLNRERVARWTILK